MTIYLAKPRGFCAGVDRAVEIVERALSAFGAPVYVRHEIVHNQTVCGRLSQMGARFVDELSEVPAGMPVIFSAHGVSPGVKAEAQERGLKAIDATCPLVMKVHSEIMLYAKQGYEILLIGHKNHVEVIGTYGHAPSQTKIVETRADAEAVQVSNPEKVAFVTQTTLSMDDLKDIIEVLRQRFPLIRGPKKDDICYATQNRQNAVKSLVPQVDLLLVVGDPQSSNANRLVDVARTRGIEARLVGRVQDFDHALCAGKRNIGITAGASTPEDLVQSIVSKVRECTGHDVVEVAAVQEFMKFPLPQMGDSKLG